MANRLGRFGAMVKNYERARRKYPREVFVFLKSLITVQRPFILDLGCGTGISTRQLVEFGTAVGCDPDLVMLRAAKKHSGRKILYVRGSAERLPFRDSTFDAVTAFAAFHWFDNKESIREVRRVLKPGGLFFVVNKTGLKSWGEGYRRAIIKAVGIEIARFKEDSYDPKKSLQKNGFKKIKVRIWRRAELFTLKNALEYVQSVSIWNSVPLRLRAAACEGVKKYFQAMKEGTGAIERKLVVRAVVGMK